MLTGAVVGTRRDRRGPMPSGVGGRLSAGLAVSEKTLNFRYGHRGAPETELERERIGFVLCPIAQCNTTDPTPV